jgi:fused signal recognition particle receptor
MAFNWFRRQFTQPEDSPEQTVEGQTDVASEPIAEESAADATDLSQEDYLAWAKAAFQNIQERQATPSVTEPASEVTPEVMPEVAFETATELEENTPVEAIAEAAAPAEMVSEVTSQVETEPSAIAEPLVSEPLREKRSDIDLDEGFRWSAEVLAAQGRRPEDISVDEINWLQKLRKGLDKTRRGVVNQLKTIVGKGPLTQDSVQEIESILIQADVGIEATDAIIASLQKKMVEETLPPDAAIAYLKTILRDILDAPFQSNYNPVFAPEKGTLNIWLMTGINGAGKTTTIGKIAHVATESGFNCLVAAADTFRAAAVEQVKVWAQRSGIEVIANPGQNTDPAAVVFDAITAAQSRKTELLLVDTAGRLQNKKNLMDELRKVRQVIDRKAPHAKVESLLVLDATLGQNGLRQAQVFSEAAQLSGVVLTKLDGTAKGGVALAVVQQLGLPIRFIGAGEGIKDLRPFSSYEFVEALLSN